MLKLKQMILSQKHSAKCIKKAKRSGAFTIVELLVVVVVIGILASITIVSYSGITKRALVASIQSDLANAAKRLEMDRVIGEKFPTTLAAANNGMGIKSSLDSVYDYKYKSSNDTYCLSIANPRVADTYIITSANKIPTIGVCPSSTFIATWGGSAYDGSVSAIETNDGGYISAGESNTYGGNVVVKYDTDGNVVWNKDYSWLYKIKAIALSGSSNYMIAGSSTTHTSGGRDAFIAKLDANGEIIWFKTWGRAAYHDEVTAFSSTNDGGYLIAGFAPLIIGATDNRSFFVKFDADGNVVLDRNWGLAGQGNMPSSIIQDDGGNYIMTGSSQYRNPGFTDGFLVKFNSSGTMVWSTMIADTGNSGGTAVTQVGDGGYVAVGQSNMGAFAAKYSSAGSLMWFKSWTTVVSSTPFSVISTSDGGCILGGYLSGLGAGSNDFFAAKLAVNSDQVWIKTWGGAGSDAAYSVSKSTDGGFVMAGATHNYGYANTNGDMALLKYDQDGVISNCLVVMCKDVTASAPAPNRGLAGHNYPNAIGTSATSPVAINNSYTPSAPTIPAAPTTLLLVAP